MRILLLSQYFDPEPHLKGLVFARELVRQGHQVEVLTGFPNYPGGRIYPGYRLRWLQREEVDGIRILRVPSYLSHDASGLHRMLSYLSFAFSAAVLGPWIVRRPDVIHAYHGNATIGLPACVIGAVRRAPFVLDIQDLWPDSITSSGMLPKRLSFLVAAVEGWCAFMYRQASRISVLSSGFRRTLAARGVEAEKVTVISNWCDEVQSHPKPLGAEEAELFDGRFTIVMAGNMGVMQGLDVVLDAAQRLQSDAPAIRFILVGGGIDRPRLEARAAELGLSNVAFLPRRPPSEIGAVLQRANVLLVHLKDDPLFAITIPSKIQAYLAVGRPILCGVRGDGADLVEASGGGLAFEPDDPGSLAKAARELASLAQETRDEMGARGRRHYSEHLSVEAGTRSFIRLFDEAISA